jgi:hypothetical protein
MSTIDCIEAQRDRAVKLVNAKILQATFADDLTMLQLQRDAIENAALNQELADPEMVAALSVITAATSELAKIAKIMVDVASFASNVANFGKQAAAVAAAIPTKGSS